MRLGLPLLLLYMGTLSAEDVIGPRISPVEKPTPAKKGEPVSPTYEYALELSDKDLKKVEHGAAGLVTLNQPAGALQLLRLYQQGDGSRRRIALKALGSFKLIGLDEQLYNASLAEPLLSLRVCAAESLRLTAGEETAIKYYLDTLRNLASPFIKPTKGLAERPRPITVYGKIRAIQLLGLLGAKANPDLRKAVCDTLLKSLEETDMDVLEATCEALGNLSDRSAVKPLIAMLKNKDTDAQSAASDALELLTGQSFKFDLLKWEAWQALQQDGASSSPKLTIGVAPKKQEAGTYPEEVLPVDVAVVFDTTGSMTRMWPLVSQHIDGALEAMIKIAPSMRLGSVRYRADDPDKTLTYMIMPRPLSRKFNETRDWIQDAFFGGGSGGLHLGLQHALANFHWRVRSRKIILLVGDTTPEGNGMEKATGMLREAFEQDHILCHTVYIRTAHGEEQRPTYGVLAKAGGGRFYEFDRAWNRLVDQSVEVPDPKTAELAPETAKKWLVSKDEFKK